MLKTVLSLSSYYLDNLKKENGEPVINHARRVAQNALLLGWEEEVIAACYLHEVLTYHYDSYYEVLQEIKAIDENVAKIVDKVTKKEKETWGQYYYRIIIVPEAAKVVWLDMIDSLTYAKREEFDRIYEQLPRFYQKLII